VLTPEERFARALVGLKKAVNVFEKANEDDRGTMEATASQFIAGTIMRVEEMWKLARLRGGRLRYAQVGDIFESSPGLVLVYEKPTEKTGNVTPISSARKAGA